MLQLVVKVFSATVVKIVVVGVNITNNGVVKTFCCGGGGCDESLQLLKTGLYSRRQRFFVSVIVVVTISVAERSCFVYCSSLLC